MSQENGGSGSKDSKIVDLTKRRAEMMARKRLAKEGSPTAEDCFEAKGRAMREYAEKKPHIDEVTAKFQHLAKEIGDNLSSASPNQTALIRDLQLLEAHFRYLSDNSETILDAFLIKLLHLQKMYHEKFPGSSES